MKYRFPILTAVALALGAAIFAPFSNSHVLLAVVGQGRGGGNITPVPDPETNPSSAHNDSSANSKRPAIPQAALPPVRPGQPLVVEAGQRIFRLPSLDAKMRQRIDLFGHQLTGYGSYKQQGLGDVKLLRLELKLQAVDRVTSLQQVCDGRFLWVRRDSPYETSLTRIDLKEVRRAIEAKQDSARDEEERPATDLTNQWMALGGLPKLLQGLDANYDFGSALPEQLSDLPVWVIPGQLKKERLATLLPNQKKKILAGEKPNLNGLSAQWPDRVVLTLGRDNILPLFPYRIEFQRTRPVKKKSNEAEQGRGGESETVSPEVASIVTLELFEVQAGAEIDARQFQYPPGNQEVLDDTQRFLQNLGLIEN